MPCFRLDQFQQDQRPAGLHHGHNPQRQQRPAVPELGPVTAQRLPETKSHFQGSNCHPSGLGAINRSLVQPYSTLAKGTQAGP